jgi:tRNA threonylcarbamoyladenosine biosynthesis protein TsaB
MKILALDTCLDACSVAVCENGAPLATHTEFMSRGHQERLAPIAAAVMAEAGQAFDNLDLIAATVGPGSFTGLRVGLAFAKGLGLALARPVVGIGVLEALAAGEPDELVAAAVTGPREQLYLQIFASGRPLTAPDCLPSEVAAARLAEFAAARSVALVGSGAASLATIAPNARIVARAAPDPSTIARLAAKAPSPAAMPRPLYLRPPDARPSQS